jgi:putative ABC transport system permease protein
MQSFWQDISYGIRMLKKNPGVTILAIVALALGIGVNTAIFSIADAFLLKPVPFPNLDHVVTIYETVPHRNINDNSASPANFEDWKNQSHSFDRLAAFQWDSVNLTGEGNPQRVQGFLVSQNFFETLSEQPVLGRAFLPEEEQPGRDHEVMLTHGLWERRYGSDRNLIGKSIQIDAESYTVVGVMGKGFKYPFSVELWMPLAMDAKEKAIRKSHYLFALGQLKPGISVSQARAELVALSTRLSTEFPQTNKGWGVRVLPFRQAVSGDLTRQYTLLLMGAVGFVLLIACANIANLQLARAANRQKEIALRAALGATRWRVIRQLLTESVLMALAGGAAGLLVAEWSIDLILSNMPPDVARYIAGWQEIRLDSLAFLFTLALAIAAGILSGLAPALQCAKTDINETLKEGGLGSSASRRRHLIRNILVVAEVSMSVILLVGAGLLVKGFRALINVNQNFEPNSLLTFRISLPAAKYGSPQKISAFHDETLRQLQTIPGVKSASLVTSVPYSNSYSSDAFSIEGRTFPVGEVAVATRESVSPNYLQTMHIPLLRGRGFSESDSADSPEVAIISEVLAERYWPAENPLGKRIKLGAVDSKSRWAEIVGVAGEVKYNWISSGQEPTIYFSYRQHALGYSQFALRTSGDPNSFTSAVRSRIANVDPEQPISEVKPLAQVIHESVMGIAYVAVMMAVLGVIALLLSAVGVFGVMAYSVTERTREFGIRIAFGAQQKNVLRMVFYRGMLLTGIGLGIGLPIALAMSQLLASLLYGVSASDPIIFSGVTILLTGIAMLACYIPAKRAMQVDPMVALRYE